MGQEIIVSRKNHPKLKINTKIYLAQFFLTKIIFMIFNILSFKLLACFDKKLKTVPQLTFTCSKSTIETLQKGVKYVQSY